MDTHPLVFSSGLVDLVPKGMVAAGWAVDINVDRAIVGSLSPGFLADSKAFRLQGGALDFLPDLGGPSYAFHLNDPGAIVGVAYDTNEFAHAVEWRGGVLVNLESLRAGTQAFAIDINNHGFVVGTSSDTLGVNRPVAWANGRIEDLGTADPDTDWGVAHAVNDHGRIVGESAYIDSTGYHGVATLWRRDGTVRSLGVLNAAPSIAYDVNDHGQVVGQSDVSSGRGRAVLWLNGSIFDLNDLIDGQSGWELNEARGINDRGQIVGTGLCPCGGQRGFLLTPM